ncbi:serine/threonine-protein phosphatase 4 regulatory subunit 3 isoform X2 [Galendromus occidentalis]|uniref:Serine/threonine-protein phosphatase 4 regulatory subunit 3 isoform X2 n=1 Tax=Galendromus occidentalis TaxID=34638 RepID=A0AAJ7P9I3_9ACAR|nr:serine/threonine-protein phosphatase 4 regulatory subunit 3 isoform X2 [Galendromus occidentalis]
MRSLVLLLVLPAVAYGALIFGGANTAKRCSGVLVNGTVKDNVADPDDCTIHYVCTRPFQAKLRCRNGQHFSATEKKCTDPCTAACDTSLVCTTADPLTSNDATAATDAAAELETSSSDSSSVSASSDPVTAGGSTGGQTVPSGEDSSPSESSARNSSPTESTANTSDSSDATISDSPTPPQDSTVRGSTGTAESRADDDATTEGTTSQSVETTTAFWQTIAKHFNQPPSTIPGFSGTIKQ